MALGGSTNALVHVIAMAGRAGVPIVLEDFDEISKRTPLVCNLRPAGKYLMEDFYYAGGLPALLGELRELLNLDEKTITGKTLGENIAGAKVYNTDVIRSKATALAPEGGAGGGAREPGAQRRGHQDRLGRPEAAEAHRAGGGVRRLQRSRAAAGRREPGRHGGFGAGAAQRRAAGRAGLPRVGHVAHPQEAAEAGRAGHGAPERRAHERHQLRHLRAARLARELRRRPAGAGARRRPDRAGRARPAAWT